MAAKVESGLMSRFCGVSNSRTVPSSSTRILNQNDQKVVADCGISCERNRQTDRHTLALTHTLTLTQTDRYTRNARAHTHTHSLIHTDRDRQTDRQTDR